MRRQFIDGYECDEDGKRIIHYDCDPEKNIACRKSICAYRKGGKGCSMTLDRTASRDGSKPFYIKKENSSVVTFVREYIEEGEVNRG